MPASERGREEVLPLTNQSSSAMTARRKTRFVVRRGRMGVLGAEEVGIGDDSSVAEGGEEEEEEDAGAAGFDNEKRS